ncbi:MAG TPA: methyltransferase domain-containing protein [Bryobacterales bacterium]|nr:methyltransferase domain-containing protein [Bryobacterales bacterium]
MTTRISTRDQVLGSLGIGREDFVVEIGAGHRPFRRANLIVEKYPFDQVERIEECVSQAPTIIADAIALPLPDKGCDVLFASHVLEHLPEPARLLEEARRVSRHTYLEFPSPARELMYAWSFHKWLIEVEAAHLIFYRNDLPQLFGDFFYRHHDFLFDAWQSQRHDQFNSSIYVEPEALSWEFAAQTALEHVLASSPRGAAKVNVAPVQYARYTWRQIAAIAVQSLPGKMLDLFLQRKARQNRRPAHTRPLTPELLDRLVCQRCRSGPLRLESSQIVCQSCRAAYFQKRGLFDFGVPMDS